MFEIASMARAPGYLSAVALTLVSSVKTVSSPEMSSTVGLEVDSELSELLLDVLFRFLATNFWALASTRLRTFSLGSSPVPPKSDLASFWQAAAG